MVLSMVLLWGILVYHWVSLQTGKFYVGRTRQEYVKEVDFQQVNATDIFYFLVRNSSAYAKDVDGTTTGDTVSDIAVTCS
jgi:hypothetical protein